MIITYLFTAGFDRKVISIQWDSNCAGYGCDLVLIEILQEFTGFFFKSGDL